MAVVSVEGGVAELQQQHSVIDQQEKEAVLTAEMELTEFQCEAGRLYYVAIDKDPQGLPTDAWGDLGERLDEKEFPLPDAVLRKAAEQGVHVTWAKALVEKCETGYLVPRRQKDGRDAYAYPETIKRLARKEVHKAYEAYRAVIRRVYERDMDLGDHLEP